MSPWSPHPLKSSPPSCCVSSLHVIATGAGAVVDVACAGVFVTAVVLVDMAVAVAIARAVAVATFRLILISPSRPTLLLTFSTAAIVLEFPYSTHCAGSRAVA